MKERDVVVVMMNLIGASVAPREPPSRSRQKSPRDEAGVLSGDLREDGFNVLAPWFVLRRQLQGLAEGRNRLVNREARIVGRDLEQHPARLAEIHRPEVVAVL